MLIDQLRRLSQKDLVEIINTTGCSDIQTALERIEASGLNIGALPPEVLIDTAHFILKASSDTQAAPKA